MAKKAPIARSGPGSAGTFSDFSRHGRKAGFQTVAVKLFFRHSFISGMMLLHMPQVGLIVLNANHQAKTLRQPRH